ncbi:MAG TPA: phosphatidylglycerophosphatase A [Bacteroidia bacterium]|nr:phosphatidylglycerophosphatase A [Bacteroidia bacterium]
MKTVYKIIASGFGSGFSPVAPGTAGSLAGVLLAWFFNLLFSHYDFTIYTLFYFVFCFLFICFGIISTDKLEAEWGHDSPKFVIDEIAGMLISIMFVPFAWNTVLIAFVLFRFFDILKPFGIRSLEKVHGGGGVMLDDILAGVYANVLLHVILFSFTFF